MKTKIISLVLITTICQVQASEIYNVIISKDHSKYEEKSVIIPDPILLSSCKEILNEGLSSGSGTYKIETPNEEYTVYCDMITDSGGWTMISSNASYSNIIPSGVTRNNNSYKIDRSEGILGNPSPNSDFIIGSNINYINWSEARVSMFGYCDLNTTSMYPLDLGRHIDLKWSTDGNTASERLNSVSPISSVTILSSNNFSLHSSTKYFVLDGIRKDSGFNANSNQSTIGGAGVVSPEGDTSGGTYFGHGSNESTKSSEGAYVSNGVHCDSNGYVTWIR